MTVTLDPTDPWPTDHDAPPDDHEAFTRGIALVTELAQARTDHTPEPDHELTWTDIPLGPILQGTETVTPPTWLTRTDGHHLIYPARHHDIHGEPGDGKSWVALAAVRDVIRAGRAAIWVDWEDTAAACVSRLRALNIEDPHIGDPTCFRFIRPDGPFGTLDRAALHTLAHELDAGLIVFDAMADALALDGLEENSNTDAVLWLTRICRPFNTNGTATLVLDHVSRDPATRTRGARGGGSKLAFIDGVSYALKLVRPFDRETPGEIKLIIAKDRDGQVGARGKTAARITITPHEHGTQIDLAILPPGDTTDTEGRFMPTALMERISRHMETRPGDELTGRRITEAVRGKAEYKRTALERLVELGHLSETPGPRGAVFYTLLDPYREPDEPDDEEAENPTASHRVPTASPPRPGRGQSTASPGPLSRSEGDAVDPQPGNTKNSPPRPGDHDQLPLDPDDHEEEPW